MFAYKPAVLIGSAALFGLFASTTTSRYLSNQRTGLRGVEVKNVVVAVADIEAGSTITSDNLKTADWPVSSFPSGAFTDVETAVGRVTKTLIVTGEPVLTSKLAEKGAGTGLQALIPKGMRAMTVLVENALESVGFLVSGVHVDVVATMDPEAREEEVTTKVILQNIKVLSVENKKDDSGKAVSRRISRSPVTLLVSPAEAEKLGLAAARGKIQLVVRGSRDRDVSATPGITTEKLLPPKQKQKIDKTNAEDKAKEIFSRASTDLLDGHLEDALSKLNTLLQVYPLTTPVNKAREMKERVEAELALRQRRENFQEHMDRVQECTRVGRFKAGLDLCAEARIEYVGLKLRTGADAVDRIRAKKANLKKMQKTAKSTYQLFVNYWNNDEAEHANRMYEKLVNLYPQSSYALAARETLEKNPGRDEQ